MTTDMIAEHMVRFMEQVLDELMKRDEALLAKKETDQRRARWDLKKELLDRISKDPTLDEYKAHLVSFVEKRTEAAHASLAKEYDGWVKNRQVLSGLIEDWKASSDAVKTLRSAADIANELFPHDDPQSTRSKGMFMSAVAGLKSVGAPLPERAVP